jgi:NAD+ synthase (glutamine-hydrolysing)
MVQAGAHDSVRQFEGVAFENLQARLRGITLMTLSNQFNWLVLTTGNKSEAAAGYSTLYGDSVGAYAPIKDVPKMLVYDLARYRNEREGRALIPQNSIDKAPSAELRPNQTDQDSLPPYPLLDALIQAIVVEDRDIEDLVDSGFDRSLVERFLRMLYGSEFKRRQVAPGTKITPRAFGKDRRWPITHRYRG